MDCVSDNFTLSDLAAALGIVQLEKPEKTNARRGEIVGKYNDAFDEEDWIETPVVKDYATKLSHHNYVIRVDGRDELHRYLNEKGISTSVHYVPNNHYRVYREFRGDTPVADEVWKKLLTLPLFPDLTDEQVDFIVSSVIEFGKS
ncbi:MAG: DegT/DnrJ/EryC1/StrS family aminotransferase [bacterium]